MNNMTVYNQLTCSESSMFNVLKNEIGIKTNCIPFAVKAIDSLKSLGSLTQREALNAANTFLSDLQTLNQGGIIAEDYDKIDFIKRGKVITISARVEAFLRAAARKGYRITDTIVAVPKEDKDTTYFKEIFYNGNILYTLEDRRFNADRKMTAERIVDKYFSKYICRLEVSEISSGKRILMTNDEMSNDELNEIAKSSEKGFFKSQWVAYTDQYGKARKRKVITNEYDTDSIWYKWTGEMVKKTIIRRALKRVREVLPELKETIYAFEKDNDENFEVQSSVPEINIPDLGEAENHIDLNKLTTEQKADVKETLEIFKAKPKLASQKAEEVKKAFENGEEKQEIIDREYASIMNIKKSKNLWPIIEKYIIEGGEANADEKSKP